MKTAYTTFAKLLVCASMLLPTNAFAEETIPSTNQSNRATYSHMSTPQKSGGKIYGEWIILSANGRNVNIPDAASFININASDGKLYGDIAGNVVNARFKVKDQGGISFSGIEITHLPSKYVREENDIKTGLSETCTFSITKKKNDIFYLDLYDNHGNVVVHAKRHNADVMSGIWKIDKLDRKDISSTGLEIVVDVPELKIHGNSGCNIFNGDIGLDRNKDWFIQFQNITVSRMKCEEEKMAIERDLLVALEEVEIIKRENNGKVIRLLDKNKEEILLLKRVDSKN